jgi:hypothetical protein
MWYVGARLCWFANWARGLHQKLIWAALLWYNLIHTHTNTNTSMTSLYLILFSLASLYIIISSQSAEICIYQSLFKVSFLNLIMRNILHKKIYKIIPCEYRQFQVIRSFWIEKTWKKNRVWDSILIQDINSRILIRN